MLKKIPVAQLEKGRYNRDLNCGRMDHPFFRNQFLVDDAAMARQIADIGIAEVYIDTSRGADKIVAHESLEKWSIDQAAWL